jgi:hypothetical protein
LRIDPVVHGRFEGKLSAKMAGIEGKKDVATDQKRDNGDDAGTAPAKCGKEENHDRQQQERKVEKAVCELPEGSGDRKRRGKQVLRNGVGLARKPVHAGKHKEDAEHIGGSASEKYAPLGAKEP